MWVDKVLFLHVLTVFFLKIKLPHLEGMYFWLILGNGYWYQKDGVSVHQSL